MFSPFAQKRKKGKQNQANHTMITTAIIYSHKAKQQREAQLEIRIIIRRRTFYFPTGIKVLRRNFVNGKICNQSDAMELNERLALIYNKVLEEINTCIRDDRPIDIRAIRNRVWQTTEADRNSSNAFLDWIEDQLPNLPHRQGTINHYHTLLLRLRQFGGIRQWADITIENIYAFDTWLHKLPAQSNKQRTETAYVTQGTVYNYHKCLKAMLNRALEFGRIAENPYIRLRGKFKRGDNECTNYLTEDEIQRFIHTTPPPGTAMDLAHDLFIFQLFTGLAYSDTQTFSMQDYQQVNGIWQHTGQRVKTGTPYVNCLLDPAIQVLEKYGWNTPKINNAKYNLCLKALGMVAGITQPLHSHLARHTFATLMLSQGAPIQNVSAMLGHTNVKQTQRYAKVLASSINKDFRRMEKKLKKIIKP